MTEATEPTQEIPKVKKSRTPEQLEVLAKARQKALEVRKANAELRKKEKEIELKEKENKIKERKKKIEEYEEPEPEPEPVKIKKSKKKIVIEESESESEEEVVVVKKKKPVKRIVEPDEPIRRVPREIDFKKLESRKNYRDLYEKMFKRI